MHSNAQCAKMSVQYGFEKLNFDPTHVNSNCTEIFEGELKYKY